MSVNQSSLRTRELGMKRFVFWVVCAAVLSPLVARAQKSDQAEEKGTYLGVLFGPVRDGPGVVVTHVLPDSPAAKSKVNRDDLILQYDKTKVTDCEHFARLISADKPDRTVKLLVQRDGAQRTVEVTLTTGPVLRIGRTNPAGTSKTTDDSSPKGTAKPTAPASVSVTALPLGENRIRLTIE